MPFGGLMTAMSFAGPALGIGSSLAGIFGGTPSQNVQMPSYLPQHYDFQNQGGADAGAYSGIGGLSQWNIPGQLLPQYQSIAQNAVNNPYAGGYQSGANMAGGLTMGAGLNAYGAGGDITGSSLGALPDVSALLSMGFDPQNALYSRTLQQVQDQTRASEAARGIQTTPYGAGLENDQIRNFNIDWQNNALQRAATGAGAAGGLLGQIGQGATTGQNLQAGAGPLALSGAGMPYNAFQNINANALGVLGQTGQFGLSAAQLPQQTIQDYLAYLSGATSQQSANTGVANAGTSQGQLGLNQANSVFNQQQALGGQLGSSLAGLGKAFGNSGWGNTGSGWFGSYGGTGGGLGGYY